MRLWHLPSSPTPFPLISDGYSTVSPTERFVTVRLVGDEHCHAYYDEAGNMMTEDGNGFLRATGRVDFASFYRRQVMRNVPHHTLNLDSEGRTNFPTVGNMNGIIILVEFADNSFQPEYNRELFDSLANAANFSYDGAAGSIAQYFATRATDSSVRISMS